MNRRDALRLMASTAGGLVTGGGLLASEFVSGAPSELFNGTSTPVYAGWVDDARARREFVRTHRYPFLQQSYGQIKGTGAGKKVLLWKLFEQITGKPLVSHQQTIGDCFAAGTMVTMADGSRKHIEQVATGDEVLTHLGRVRKVVRTIRKSYEGRMLRLQAEGVLEDIVCTPDHKFLVRGDRWETASYLKMSDAIYTQRYTAQPVSKVWDLLDILPDSEVKGDRLRAKGSAKWVKRYISLTQELSYVIGAYLAEGGCTQTKKGTWCKVDFNLGSTEIAFARDIATKMEKVFGTSCDIYSVPSKPSVLYVRCQSKAVAEFFKSVIPGNTYTKEVPPSILVGLESVQRGCLLGWLEGDGSCPGRKQRKAPVKRGARCSGTSVSKNLLLGMVRLANCCGLTPGLSERKVKENRAPAFDLQFNVEDTAELYPAVTTRDYDTTSIAKFGVERTLQRMTTISKVRTTVYCLEIEEDRSFIANGYSVHNCVAHAAGLSIDILTAVRILMQNHSEKWVAKAATEIIYAGARIEVGGGQLGYSDGSWGVWAGEFVRKWGVLLRQEYLGHDFTTYSGRVARTLGSPRKGVPDELEPLCKLHPVKTCALVKSWEECRDSVANGYPVAMCSNIGFTTKRDSNGFLRRSRRPWYHAMAIIGVDDEYRRPGALVQNSWGRSWASGPKRHEQPDGSFWCDADTIDAAMRQGDSIAFSGYVGYPRNDIPDYIIF